MMKRRKKTRLRLKKWVWMVFFVIFLFVLIFFAVKVFIWKDEAKKSEDLAKEVSEIANVETVEETDENTEVVNPPEDEESDYWRYIKMDMINADFNELKKINKDTVAWVKLNGTNINYPVVQTNNNDYYLSHAFDGSYNKAGWVYADYRNNLNTLDKNTIIYGHGRVDKTMFGSLKNIMYNDWYNNKDNHVVKLSTPKENTLWQVFSVYKIKAESYYITTKFASDDEFNKFLTTLKERSKFKFNTNVSTNDKILTLSTCLDSYGTRIVLHAKLIKVQSK